MIDLMALVKEVDNTYMDVENSLAGTIRVYHIPDAMLLSIGLDRLEPELPTVRMKTATGYQNRQAKTGDKAYDQYLQDKSDYEDESFRLRVAIGTVYALKDIDWTKYDLSTPPPIEGAIEMYKSGWPDHHLLRKKAWLDWTILFKRQDATIIGNAMSEMNGTAEPDDDMVDAVKKNSA